VKTKTKKESKSILFVVLPYLVWSKGSAAHMGRIIAFPYGVLSIASYVKKNIDGHLKINILDLNLYSQEERQKAVVEALKASQPEIVAISMMFDFCYEHLNPISKTIKNYDDKIIVVLGGGSATVSWNMILHEQDYVDAICYGEGELAILQLIEAENIWQNLLNDPVWVTRQSLASKQSPQVKYLDNLNELIEIDYELVNIEAYGMKEGFSPFSLAIASGKPRQFAIVTSRGCPFKCVFCSAPSLHGKQVRCADVDILIEHVKYLIAKYGMNILTLYDDQILYNQARAKELFRRLAEFKLRVEVPTGLSVTFIDEEMVELMKGAGIDTAALAIESGSARMLKNVIHKPLRLEQVKPVVEMLRRHNIFVYGFFVVGLPGELEEDRIETIRFIKEIGLDWSSFSLATPVRGSELYKICVENSYIDPSFGIGCLGVNDYVIKAPGLDPKDIKRKRYLMNLDVNFVNNHRMIMGDYETAKACFRDVIDRYEKQAFAHYYLAQCLEAQKAEVKEIKQAMVRVNEIIHEDSVWLEYFEYFGIDIMAKINSSLITK